MGNSAWDMLLEWARAKVKGYDWRDGFIVHLCGEARGYTLVIPADEALFN